MDQKETMLESVCRKIKEFKVHYLIIYFILFYLTWTLKEGYISHYISNNKGLDASFRTVLTGSIKILVWVIPVLIFLKGIDHEKPLKYLKLNVSVLRGLLWGAIICLIYIGISLAKDFILGDKTVNFTLDFDKWLNTIILAGLTEEIVFRGFILQKFEAFLDFWQANIITSILFVTIHFPKWVFNEDGIAIQSMFSVFILGIAFGYAFKRTNSLWASILFHAANNFIVLSILGK